MTMDRGTGAGGGAATGAATATSASASAAAAAGASEATGTIAVAATPTRAARAGRSGLALVAGVALATFAAGCGGGSSSSGAPTTVPTGIFFGTGLFTGTQTINGYTSPFRTSPYVLGFVTSAGSYMLLSYSMGSPNTILAIDSGAGGVTSGSFDSSTNLHSYMYPSIPIYQPQGGLLSATFVLNSDLSGRSINGSIDYAGTQGAVLSFPLGYVGGDVVPATLAAVAGTFTGTFYSNQNTSGYGTLPPLTSTFTVSATGALAGTVACPGSAISPPPGPQTPCTVSGTLTPRTDLNAYDVSFSFANGSATSFISGFTGKTATGLAYYDATSHSLMFGGIAPDTTAFSFSN